MHQNTTCSGPAIARQSVRSGLASPILLRFKKNSRCNQTEQRL